MKIISTKKISLAFIGACIASVGFAQSFDLGNSIVEKTGDKDAATIDLYVDVTNISSTDYQVNVSRENIEVGSTMNLFCWGTNCYPPNVDLSTTPETILAGATNTTFKGQLMPGGNAGTYLVKYCFIATDNSAEDLCFNAKYVAKNMSTIEENTMDAISLGNVAPNPVTGNVAIFPVNVGGASHANIEIYNAFGKVVKTISFENNSDAVAADISDLDPGMYIYQLVGENNMKSVAKKMIIK